MNSRVNRAPGASAVRVRAAVRRPVTRGVAVRVGPVGGGPVLVVGRKELPVRRADAGAARPAGESTVEQVEQVEHGGVT